MSREELLALAERVESATGADVALDALILRELFSIPERVPLRQHGWPLTASLDAVLALVAEKLPGWLWEVRSVVGGELKATLWASPVHMAPASSEAVTPALALLATFLRALATTAASGGGEGVS